MRVAFGAGDSGANHAESCVADFSNVLLGDRLIEAGPARARLEFRGGVEQSIVAADTPEETFVVQVPILPRKGHLGISVARDVIGVRRELLAPFIRRFDHLGDADSFEALAGIGEDDYGDFFRLAGSGSDLENTGLLPLPEREAGHYRCGASQKYATRSYTRFACGFVIKIGFEHRLPPAIFLSLLCGCVASGPTLYFPVYRSGNC